MERQRIMIVVLIAAITLAGIASYSIYSYLQKQQQEVERSKAEMGAVVVAAADIPFGSRIQEGQVKKVTWPKANIPAGTFTDPAALLGRTVLSTIVAGEPLMQVKLAPTEAKGGVMAYIIPEGHRAMAVAVNEVTGVGGFVLPNSKVDVVVTTTQAGKQTSKIVLQNLDVLAIGQKMEEKEGKAVVVPTVTVSITPEEAEKLALASNSGPLQLLLRGTKDAEIAPTRGATLPNLFEGRRTAPAATAKIVMSKPVEKAGKIEAMEKEEVKPVRAEIAVIEVIKASRTDIKRSQDVLTRDKDGFWSKKEVAK